MLTLILSFFTAAICILSPKIPIGAGLSVIILIMTRNLDEVNFEGALARKIAKITLVVSLCLCAAFAVKGYYEQQKAEQEAIEEEKRVEEAAAALEKALAEEATEREAEEAEKAAEEEISAIGGNEQTVTISQETEDEPDSLQEAFTDALEDEFKEDEEYQDLKNELGGKDSSNKAKEDSQKVTITESEESEEEAKAKEEAKGDTSLYLYTVNYKTTLPDGCLVTIVGTVQYYSGDDSIIKISHTVIDEILSQYTAEDIDSGAALEALQKKFENRIAEEIEIKSAEITEIVGVAG
jgi:hypothetical protein